MQYFQCNIFLGFVQRSYAQESAYDRLFSTLMRRYQKSVKPGSPTETTRVKLGLTVICAEHDRLNGYLKTHAWLYMVRTIFFRRLD